MSKEHSDSAAETIEIAGRPVAHHYGDAAAEYDAARRAAVVIRRSHEGRVRAVGGDRLDLLDRMSTNAMTDLAAGEARPTVFTTPIARIIDLVWVLNRGDEALLVTGVGRAPAVRRWLAGYIFFRDDVKLPDASGELEQIGLFGPKAAAIAEAIVPGAESLAEDRFLEQDEVIVWRGQPLAGGGFSVIAPASKMAAAWQTAVAAGARPAGEACYQMLRLAAGRPAAEHELTEVYLPLEVDLWNAVSFTKGCYIGQEINARMESRGKLARRLVGLKLGAPVAAGAEVRAGDSVAGRVTSAAVLPDRGPVALAVLKTAVADAGTPVMVGEVPGAVAALPFE